MIHFSRIFYSVPIFLTRLSILLQLLRIFVVSRTGNSTYYIIWTIICANLFFYVSSTFALIFACDPVRKTWNPTVPGHCINQRAVLIASVAVNVVSNIATLIIPFDCLWRLQMPLRRKFGVSVIFATGIG